jgi:hypothetical protein
MPIRAFAWGYDAHRIIAEIAGQFLQTQTAHQVRELLAIENVTTLAEVSTWADENPAAASRDSTLAIRQHPNPCIAR